MAQPLIHVPHREPASAVDKAIDAVEAARKQQEWEDTVRLAEQVFPPGWDVRVEHFTKQAHVSVKFVVAYGSDPIDALKQAIEWYRSQNSTSRIVLPGRK